ncbi:hypothetical protein D3C72_1544520 [compost metagenome]
MAANAITAGTAIAKKFCCNGRLIPTKVPITIGARIAPLRPTPEAQPMPVERTAMG